MKTKNWLIILILGASALLSGCTQIYISVISKSPELNLTSGNLKTAMVVGTDGLVLREFKKTFNNKYRNNHDFIDEYIQQFTTRLQMANLFTQVKCDTSLQWSTIKSFAGSQNDFKTIDSLFNNCISDYIINISEFEIGNSIRSYSTGGGPNMPTTYSSTEYCVVNTRFQVIDKKTRKSILEFKSTGDGSVVLFAFEEALRKATANSIDHAIAYLRTGQTEFKR